jgi:tRNA threonylcarbamoyladenosine biosynthesis protein TsaB
LAIDTSTDRAAIALATEHGVVVHSWAAARAQTTTVLPEIDRLVREAHMTPADVTGLVVATGPGTFTGLRVGLAIAKGIVAASGVPLVGIPTLDVVFAMHPSEDVIAVLPAGRGRVVWQVRGESPNNSTIDELIAALKDYADVRLVGELLPDQAAMLDSAGVRVLHQYRDPAVLLQLGAVRIAAGDLDDPVTLQPTYLHGITVNAGPIQDRLRKS